MNKKRLLGLAMAGIMTAGMAVPAFASGSGGGAVPSGQGTQVQAGIILHDPDAKIKIEVPSLFAFVVHGVVDATDTSAVTSSNGFVLLPNVKVKVSAHSNLVDDPAGSGNTAVYHTEVEGDGRMVFKNYSTWEDPADGVRKGMSVTVNGTIQNEGTAISRNHWEHVYNADDGSVQGATAGFKKYTIAIDGAKFDQAVITGGLTMATPISLSAPNLDIGGAPGSFANMNSTTKLATVGEEKEVAFNVFVGGQRNQYKQVEQSAKIGTIVWTVTSDGIAKDVYTAPLNNYLDGDPNTPGQGNLDPDLAIQ